MVAVRPAGTYTKRADLRWYRIMNAVLLPDAHHHGPSVERAGLRSARGKTSKCVICVRERLMKGIAALRKSCPAGVLRFAILRSYAKNTLRSGICAGKTLRLAAGSQIFSGPNIVIIPARS